MSAILIIFFLPDRLKWKHVYHFSNIQTLFMIFLVKALALQSYNKCDYFLVTRNNLDEKKRLLEETSVLLILMNTQTILLTQQIINLSVSFSN